MWMRSGGILVVRRGLRIKRKSRWDPVINPNPTVAQGFESTRDLRHHLESPGIGQSTGKYPIGGAPLVSPASDGIRYHQRRAKVPHRSSLPCLSPLSLSLQSSALQKTSSPKQHLSLRQQTGFHLGELVTHHRQPQSVIVLPLRATDSNRTVRIRLYCPILVPVCPIPLTTRPMEVSLDIIETMDFARGLGSTAKLRLCATLAHGFHASMGDIRPWSPQWQHLSEKYNLVFQRLAAPLAG